MTCWDRLEWVGVIPPPSAVLAVFFSLFLSGTAAAAVRGAAAIGVRGSSMSQASDTLSWKCWKVWRAAAPPPPPPDFVWLTRPGMAPLDWRQNVEEEDGNPAILLFVGLAQPAACVVTSREVSIGIEVCHVELFALLRKISSHVCFCLAGETRVVLYVWRGSDMAVTGAVICAKNVKVPQFGRTEQIRAGPNPGPDRPTAD